MSYSSFLRSLIDSAPHGELSDKMHTAALSSRDYYLISDWLDRGDLKEEHVRKYVCSLKHGDDFPRDIRNLSSFSDLLLDLARSDECDFNVVLSVLHESLNEPGAFSEATVSRFDEIHRIFMESKASEACGFVSFNMYSSFHILQSYCGGGEFEKSAIFDVSKSVSYFFYRTLLNNHCFPLMFSDSSFEGVVQLFEDIYEHKNVNDLFGALSALFRFTAPPVKGSGVYESFESFFNSALKGEKFPFESNYLTSLLWLGYSAEELKALNHFNARVLLEIEAALNGDEALTEVHPSAFTAAKEFLVPPWRLAEVFLDRVNKAETIGDEALTAAVCKDIEFLENVSSASNAALYVALKASDKIIEKMLEVNGRAPSNLFSVLFDECRRRDYSSFRIVKDLKVEHTDFTYFSDEDFFGVLLDEFKDLDLEIDSLMVLLDGYTGTFSELVETCMKV